MKDHFKWRGKDFPADARATLKTNEEYHGLERHAKQYHLSAMYREAYQFWLIAAAWRRMAMQMNGFTDEKHRRAIEFDIKNALFNQALTEWQEGNRPLPAPEEFDLDSTYIERQDADAQTTINTELVRRGLKPPFTAPE